MIIYVDIDNTICETLTTNYSHSVPIKKNIDKINSLYDKKHIIVYWTARGTLTGETEFALTLRQLTEWGCKFHELRMGKPFFDIFIDDKATKIQDLQI